LALFELQFLNGIKVSPLNPQAKEYRDYIRKLGAPQVGNKDLEITGPIGWWMKWGSWMKPTEVANRMAGSYAGLLYAETLTGRLRGETLMPFKNWSSKRAKQELQEKFQLTEAEIKILENYGLKQGDHPFSAKFAEGGNAEVMAVRDKILHYSHMITQGSTATSYLPLWWSSKHVEAATLFYRMAYSGTYNVAKHILQPIKTRGDLMPLARAMFAGNVLGSGLWSLYANILGVEPPKDNDKSKAALGWKYKLSVLAQNLWKIEGLGLFSFLLSPYNNWHNAPKNLHLSDMVANDSVFFPAVFRNIQTAMLLGIDLFGLGTSYLTGGKAGSRDIDITQAIDNAIGNTIVVWKHILKAMDNVKNPYKTDVKRIGVLRRQWLMDSGFAEEIKNDPYGEQGGFLKSHYQSKSPQGWMFAMVREAFNNGDYDNAAKYFVATRYYLYDHLRVVDGKLDLHHNPTMSRVKSRLTDFVNRLNPLRFSKNKGERDVSKEEQFLNWLGPDKKEMTEKVYKQYRYRRRQFENSLKKYQKIQGDFFQEGKRVDLLPVPPGKWWNLEGNDNLTEMDYTKALKELRRGR